MKKALLFSFILAVLCLFTAQESKASITLKYIDTTGMACKIPHTQYITFDGAVTGTFTTADSVTVKVNFGDGTDTTYKTPIYPPSNVYYSWFPHVYTYAGTFNLKIKVYAPTGDSAEYASISPLVVSGSCATMKGEMFVDKNSNCTWDAGELPAKYIPILAVNTVSSDTTFMGWTNDSGKYTIHIAPGSYKIIPNAGWHTWWSPWWGTASMLSVSCPSAGYSTHTITASSSYTQDFALECNAITSYDASIVGRSNGYVPGDTSVLTIWSGNWWYNATYGCVTGSATVTATLDSRLTYVGTIGSYPAPSVSGSTLTWTIAPPNLYTLIRVKTATTVAIGDTICFTSATTAVSGLTDPNTANNTFVSCRAAAASFDPNMKEVAPKGKDADGFIDNGTPLTYTVHFQNTGTAPAKNVTITDEIDADLDLYSIHMLGSTHPVRMYIDNNTVRFRFEGINLPDSTSDYYGSMGSVTYGIMPKQDLAPGTKMTNKAAIYFDYNDPIITNEVLNTIKFPTHVNELTLGKMVATVAPNPANNLLTVKSNQPVTITMFDVLGRVESSGFAANGEAIINTSNMPAGMHVVVIRNEEGKEMKTKVMIQH